MRRVAELGSLGGITPLMKTNTLGRYILASALFLCWATFLTIWYLTPILMKYHHDSFGQVRSEVAWPVAVAAWASFTGAVVALAWPRLSAAFQGQAETVVERSHSNAA